MMNMEQTTVNQFFSVRKNSSSVHPSKRRKLDTSLKMKTVLQNENQPAKGTQATAKNVKTRRNITTKSKKRTEGKAMTISDLFSVPAISETTVIDDHANSTPKREISSAKVNTTDQVLEPPGIKTPTKILSGPVKTLAVSPKLTSTGKNYRLSSQIEVNPCINEQAKSVLYSRGAALLNAGLKKTDKPNSPVKASEVLLTVSPKKAVLDQSKPRRERLRNKYAHLLKNDSIEENKPKVSPLSNDDIPTEKISKTGKERAHEKFRHLTEKAVPSEFILPQKYKVLLEMFKCADSVLFLLNQRKEICSFDRLKKSVQSMCGRDFTLKHLAAMKTVYPNAFIFRQEKGLHSASGKSSDYQLTIEANFKDCLISSTKVTSSVLITRRLKIESGLLNITKSFHQKFLRKLNLKISDAEIHRWHPHFKLNEIPDIELSNIPRAPVTKGYSSAADVLMNNKGNLALKVEKALQCAAEKMKQEALQQDCNKIDTPTTEICNSTKTINNKNNKLKGVSQSILDRVREKEQKKLELAMTRDPKLELRLGRMERLPTIARILRTYFTSERKVAITMEDCVNKLSESYGTALQTVKLEEHVRLLSELVPDWLTIAMIRKCPYVKLAKNYNINNVMNTLSNAQKLEASKS